MSEKSTVEPQESELPEQEITWSDSELAALKQLIEERMRGEFVDLETSRRRIEEMIAAKSAFYGL